MNRRLPALLVLAACDRDAFAPFDTGADTTDAELARVGNVSAWTWDYGNNYSYAGAAVESGDLNNDGKPDLVVAVPYHLDSTDRRGRVAVFYGGGVSPWFPSTPNWQFDGTTNTYAGRCVAVGDFNADGKADLAVGQTHYDSGVTTDGGRLLFFFGPLGTGNNPTPSTWLAFGTTNMHMGVSCDAIDANGDGRDELLASGDKAGTGVAALIEYTSTGSLQTRWSYTAPAGSTPDGFPVSNAGDVNGDGREDAILALPAFANPDVNEGRAQIHLGLASGYLQTTPSWTLEGNAYEAALGAAWEDNLKGAGLSLGRGGIDGVGDINGDGYDDVAVGLSFRDDPTGARGEVRVYAGSSFGMTSTPIATRYGAAAGGRFGIAVRGIGDVNADGLDDMYVGEPGRPGDDGTDHVWFGVPWGLSDESWSKSTAGSGEQRGLGAVGIADMDGDKRGEVALVRAEPNESGAVAVHFGTKEPDADSDGVVDILDCNDADKTVYPGAPIVAGDNIDQNCDGWDECYGDRDADGFGNKDDVQKPQAPGCTERGESAVGTDCDDDDDRVYPGADDVVDDGVDQDCGGADDCYQDSDLDGWGSLVTIEGVGSKGCTDLGESSRSDDCNDAAKAISPDGTEVVADGVDQDCDGYDVCYKDADQDAHGTPTATVKDADADLCADKGESKLFDDCNDAAATVYTGAPEVMGNGVDEDCDGNDECWKDSDADAWGSSNSVKNNDNDACLDSGESTKSGDCKDTDPSINPGATEVFGDGIDQNCDGADGCYQDVDLDSYGGKTAIADNDNDGCKDPGESLVSTDCKDSDKGINPGVIEVVGDGVDQDCDLADECFLDADKDGYGTSTYTPNADGDACLDAGESKKSNDCDDGSAVRWPGNPEIAVDGIDQDCDGRDGCFADADGDGVGGKTVVTDADGDGCKDLGESLASNDCNDADKTVYPSAKEVIGDGIDQDCDLVDICWYDGDKDTFGVSSKTITNNDKDCSDPNESLVTTDCDDTRADRYPGATEIVGDGVDEDCNLQELCYKDADNDGVAGTSTLVSSDADCADSGEYTKADDCNDANAGIRPGATGIVGDAIDQDCDGLEECYDDGDLDKFGTPVRVDDNGDKSCDDPGEALVATDCDDTQPLVNPSKTEIVGNPFDDDCDGDVECYSDADGDAFGALPVIVGTDCDGPGEAAAANDCKDTDAAVNPAVAEISGDGIDQNCDGIDGCFVDNDQDGHGSTTPTATCSGSKVASTNDDCNDAKATLFPGNVEIVGDGLDQDCDAADDCWYDGDGDGFGGALVTSSGDLDCTDAQETAQAGDCDDGDAAVAPGETEVIGDDVDDDCDGNAACYLDADGDEYGSPTVTQESDGDCRDADEARVGTDCDDGNASINPGATEITGNLVDEDCSGVATCFVDKDGDGYGTDVTALCAASGTAPVSGDCDDAAGAIHPGAADAPADEVDSNCDREEYCYGDLDGDHVGGSTLATGPRDADCDDPGEAVTSNDCNDLDQRAYPGNVEVPGNGVDDDCKGGDECYVDGDGDGFGTTTTRVNSGGKSCTDPGEASVVGDCDDGDDAINPDAHDDEGDGVDSDCDGFEACWVDADGDGWGTGDAVDVADTPADDCTSTGYAPQGEDCDDDDADANPAADDVVGDGVDGDCDGSEDCWLDADGDGFGVVAVDSVDGACDAADEAAQDGDCDDDDADRNPGETDVLGDGLDQDCDGGDLCFLDIDGDGFGQEGTFSSVEDACADGALNADDCDDASASVFPQNPEVCDGRDNNCDDRIDEDFPWATPGDASTCDQEEVKLCGCDATPGGAGPIALLLGLVGLRRRRR